MKGPDALAELHGAVFDLIPRAMAVRAPSATALDPAWRRGRHRYLFPRPGMADHWECVATPEPWLYLAVGRGWREIGIQVEAPEGLRGLAEVLEPAHSERFDAFVAAAARFDPDAVTALVRVHHDKGGDDRIVPVDGRAVATNGVGREVLHGLIEAGLELEDDLVGLQIVVAPLGGDDRLGWRRAAARTVDVWRSVWGLPRPTAPPSGDELERRLGAAYRRSLRLLRGKGDPAERGALRAEARALAAAYRASGRVRPRLLDVLTERVGLR